MRPTREEIDVQVSGEPMWALLRELDDPEHLELPAGFDFQAARARFERLVSALDAAFDCRTTADRDVQDASLHARVVVPAEATRGGERLVVSISNFGALTTVSLENPGVYDANELDLLLDPEDGRRVFGVLDDLDYVVVPEWPLWQPYDGPSRLDVISPGRATWWTRFFDYL